MQLSEEEKKARSRAACRKWRLAHLDKDKERQKRWRENNPEKVKEIGQRSKRKAKYNLDDAQFSSLLSSQGNACAICRTDEPAGRGWHVDHCHSSGRTRGILCHHCNTGLGLFRDSPLVLSKAAEYLNDYRH